MFAPCMQAPCLDTEYARDQNPQRHLYPLLKQILKTGLEGPAKDVLGQGE